MAERDDETGLPLPLLPQPPREPSVLLPAAQPPFAIEWPATRRSRRVGPDDAPDDPSKRMPHGPPPMPPRRSSAPFRRPGLASLMVTTVIVAMCIGVVFISIIIAPKQPRPAREQTIELPTGQHLISAEIGTGGEVYYRYAPLQPGERPRNSVVEGRSNDGRPLGKTQFIERAAE